MVQLTAMESAPQTSLGHKRAYTHNTQTRMQGDQHSSLIRQEEQNSDTHAMGKAEATGAAHGWSAQN